MTDMHYKNGYEDICRALIFTKKAENTNMYNYSYPQQNHSHVEGLLSGLGYGAVGGGLFGAGSGLYDLNTDRQRIIGGLEKRMRSRAKVLPHPPNMVSFSAPAVTEQGKKYIRKGLVDPQAKFLYDLTEKEMKQLGGTQAKRNFTRIATPARMEGALSKIRGLGGFGRYALSRKGAPLMSALHLGLPAMAIGAGLGGLLGD